MKGKKRESVKSRTLTSSIFLGRSALLLRARLPLLTPLVRCPSWSTKEWLCLSGAFVVPHGKPLCTCSAYKGEIEEKRREVGKGRGRSKEGERGRITIKRRN